MSALKRQYPHFTLQFMSVHASKGKEADYVVIFGLEKGQHGFPSEKTTHPLLELVLPPKLKRTKMQRNGAYFMSH